MNKVKVAILGRPYTISSNDEPEHINKCVELLNKRISKISETVKIASTLDAAIFTALSFADDIIKMNSGKPIKEETNEVEKRLTSITEMIDKQLK